MIRLLLALLFSISHAFAGNQVALLVSVEGKSGPFFKREETSQRLIEKFKRHYKGDQKNLKVINLATQEDLHRELRNPQNDALFWVSHANSFEEEAGLQSESIILDIDGNNVKDIFQRIHPGLRFVAVLGCRTAPIINALKKKGYFENNDQLNLYARDKKINGKKEIRRALETYAQLEAPASVSCISQEGYEIRLTRKMGKSAGKSLKVMNRGNFLGLFPAGSPGEIQNLKVHVSTPSTLNDLKILIDSGDDKILIQSDAFNGQWKVFADVTGRPIGVGQHLYRFTGISQALTIPETYRPHACEI